jgi:hypothetical protein
MGTVLTKWLIRRDRDRCHQTWEKPVRRSDECVHSGADSVEDQRHTAQLIFGSVVVGGTAEPGIYALYVCFMTTLTLLCLLKLEFVFHSVCVIEVQIVPKVRRNRRELGFERTS